MGAVMSVHGLLTCDECAIVYLIGQKGGSTSWCAWSAAALSRLLHCSVPEGTVASAIISLRGSGVIELGVKIGNGPRPMRLTELGRAIYAELSGERVDG